MKTKRKRSGQTAEAGAAAPGSVRAGLEGILRTDGDLGVIEDYLAEHSENEIDRTENEEKADSGRRGRKKEKSGSSGCGKSRTKQKRDPAILFRELLDVGKDPDGVVNDPKYSVTETNGSVWKASRLDYWIRQNLWIRTKRVAKTRFAHNRVQREYSRVCREKGSRKNIVLKARQVGMTSYIAARLFALTVARPGTLTMLVAHNREAAEEIFRIVHRYWDNLDEGLREGPLRTSHSSARELVFPEQDSEFTVASADENAGRGRTIQNLHCTEVSRWGREGEEALAALRGALVPDGEIVLESTANGAWGPFYKEWQEAEEEGYTRHFFPWWFEESYVSDPGEGFELTAEEAELAATHGLTLRQLAWRRKEWASMRRLAAQEFAEDDVTCFRASGECVFELDVIDAALARVNEAVETRDNGRVLIWLPPRAGKEYVIGVDPAGGGADGDYSCAEVIERESGMQCAELHGHFSQKELTNRVAELGREYNWAVLAVERNNHGNGVLAHLQNEKYPEIYEQNNQMGWLTSAASKPMMIATMADILAESPEVIRSERLWNECRTFVRHGDGTTSAASGSHDDCVMAMAVALAVRRGST